MGKGRNSLTAGDVIPDAWFHLGIKNFSDVIFWGRDFVQELIEFWLLREKSHGNDVRLRFLQRNILPQTIEIKPLVPLCRPEDWVQKEDGVTCFVRIGKVQKFVPAKVVDLTPSGDSTSQVVVEYSGVKHKDRSREVEIQRRSFGRYRHELLRPEELDYLRRNLEFARAWCHAGIKAPDFYPEELMVGLESLVAVG
ncbi:MAG: hypothetical protein AAB468_00975 [Patescibacteria group bacterium]